MKEKLRRYQDLLIVAGVVAAYVLWACFLPMKCPIVWLTGVSCPGCGITRALAAVCRLDFSKAWQYNPVIFYLIPVTPVLVFAYFRKAKKLTEVLLWTTPGLMIAVYLYRLLILRSPVLEANPGKGVIAGLFQ